MEQLAQTTREFHQRGNASSHCKSRLESTEFCCSVVFTCTLYAQGGLDPVDWAVWAGRGLCLAWRSSAAQRSWPSRKWERWQWSAASKRQMNKRHHLSSLSTLINSALTHWTKTSGHQKPTWMTFLVMATILSTSTDTPWIWPEGRGRCRAKRTTA